MNFNSKDDLMKHISRVIMSPEEIADRVKTAGELISGWYDGTPMLLVSILKGSFVFMADLARTVDVP